MHEFVNCEGCVGRRKRNKAKVVGGRGGVERRGGKVDVWMCEL